MKPLFPKQMTLCALAVVCFFTFFALPVSAQYVVSNLVSNTSTFNPQQIDPNLVNGWGLASFPNSPFWVSDQNTSSSTLYTGSGSIVPLVVQIPCVVNGTVTVPCPFPGEGILFQPNLGPPGLNFFGPSGIVANTFASTGDFTISGTSAPALFIWDTLDGLIVGWNPSVNLTQGVVVANRSSAGASYGGLAIAGPTDDPHLYATNTVPGGEIDVFDKNFTLVSSFAADSNVPFLFAPYGIQTIGNKLYVTYLSLLGPAGILDVCNMSTSLTSPKCRRLFASISSPSPILASPWGIVRAPHNFGVLSNMLLVGNLGDGLIHAFEPDTGHLSGTLNLADGTPFAVPGLWGLDFGSGAPANGPTNHLFFSAGPSPVNDSAHLYGAGLFGVIMPAGGDDSSTAP